MKFGEAVARILKAEGVEYVCGYPLNYIFEYAAKEGIRPIIARTERTGGHIADAISRLSSGESIGVYATQHGPGIENGYGAVAQAYAESVPMLVIPMGYRRDEAYIAENFNSTISLRSISKSVEPINDPTQVGAVFARAFSRLRNGRGGPVVVEIPRDMWFEDVDDNFEYVPRSGYKWAPAPGDIQSAIDALLAARNPVLYVGQGVHYAKAWPQLREFAERMAIPVMTTLEGKSAFPETHPLSLGAGGRAAPRAVFEYLDEADLILGIGCSFTPTDFGVPIPSGKTIIHSTLDPDHFDNGVLVDIGLIGDAGLTLDLMTAELEERQVDRSEDIEAVGLDIAQRKEAWLEEWMPLLTSQSSPISAYRVVWELSKIADVANTVITHDSGSPRDQLSPFWPSAEPLSYLGWGKSTQLGYGLGLAMGAKLVHPDKLCVNMWGDAAIGFTGIELETCVREELPVLSILFNNHHMAMETHAMGLSQREYGTMEITGDYTAMARALGVYAERIEDPEDIIPALKRGIAQTEAGNPVLLEFMTTREIRISNYGRDSYTSPVPDNFS